MLPDIDGMEILRRLRAKENPVHIIVISARDGLEDRLEALDAGADDYLVKPFPLAEVLARVRALVAAELREEEPGDAGRPIWNSTRCGAPCSAAGQPVELTALEYRLLEYLFYRAGEVVSRTDIWERVFEDGTGGSSNAVDVYIGYLRKKLNTGDLPDLIHTRRGPGLHPGGTAAMSDAFHPPHPADPLRPRRRRAALPAFRRHLSDRAPRASIRELDDSIRQTAALLANQVELENEVITFEWQEGIGTNRGLDRRRLFQFWNANPAKHHPLARTARRTCRNSAASTASPLLTQHPASRTATTAAPSACGSIPSCLPEEADGDEGTRPDH